MNILKNSISFMITAIMITTITPCVFALPLEEEPPDENARTSTFHYEFKETSRSNYFDSSQRRYISDWTTAQNISDSVVVENSITFTGSFDVTLKNIIQASTEASVKYETSETVIYGFIRSGEKKWAVVYYDPQVVHIRGELQTIATPGGVVKKEAAGIKYPVKPGKRDIIESDTPYTLNM